MDDRFGDVRSESLQDDLKEENKEDLREEIQRDSGANSINNCFQEVLRELKVERENGISPDVDKEKDREKIERVEPEKTRELASVLYQREGAFYLPHEREGGSTTSDRTILATAVALREATDGKLVLSKEAIEDARYTSEETLRESLQEVIRTYNEERGADHNINESVMFKNFPDSVMNMSNFELLANQLMGYYADALDRALGTDGDIRNSIKFDGDREGREESKDHIKVEELRPGNDDRYNELVKNLIGGKATLSEDERGIVSNAFKYQRAEDIIPKEIPQKDNLAFMARLSIEREIPVDRLPLKNATDALRVGKELNKYDRDKENRDYDKNGREKSSENGYYSFRNAEKKFIYSILEKDKNILTNMKGREDEFKALGRGLNGLRNADEKYPHAYRALEKVSKNEKLPVTKDGKFEDARNKGEVLKAADMRKEFPGKFTKELDSLLTQSMTREIADKVVDKYGEVVDKVPVRSLFIAKNHFENREEGKQLKVAMPKNDPRHAHAYLKDVKPIDKDAKDKLIKTIDKGLDSQLREREPMGKVYVDPRYKGVPIPKDTRTETSGMRPITKGTRLDIPKDTEVIRAFIYWKGQDLDLSASLLDKDLGYHSHVSYTNLRDEWAAHSGDVTNAPHGGSEFIDIRLSDLDRMAERENVGYVAFQVNVYRGDQFAQTEDCMFGFMPREDMRSGEIYEPNKVDQAFDLKSNSMCSTTMLYDIENRQMIWSDLDIRMDNAKGIELDRAQGGNVERTINNVTAAVYSTLHQETPSMYDVLTKNAECRGELVDNPKDADIIFGMDRNSEETREFYDMTGKVEIEIDGETKLEDKQYEYHDMFDRASWGQYL